MQTLTLGIFSQLYQLRLNGQNLFVLDICTLTSIDVKFCIVCIAYPLNLNSRPVAHKLGKPKLYRTAIKAKQKSRRFSLCAFLFYQKPPMAAKKAQPTAAPDSFLPPENIWDLLRKTQEKRAQMRSNSRKVRSWWPFTTPLEPILSKNAKKLKPRRLAGAKRPLRPARKTFCIFLRFPPPRFFEFGKGCFLVVRYLTACRPNSFCIFPTNRCMQGSSLRISVARTSSSFIHW
jgi:hypothetical protein